MFWRSLNSENGKGNRTTEDVVIARVARARGLQGEVACDLETDFPERFESLARVTVLAPDGSSKSLVIEDHWFHKGRVILKFQGYDDMTAARLLVGSRLVIAEAEAMQLADDQYYEYQIVGSEAVTPQGRSLGRVTGLMRTGGTDLLIVRGDREHLIPFVEGICSDVDVAAGRIVVNLPDGLLDLNA